MKSSGILFVIGYGLAALLALSILVAVAMSQSTTLNTGGIVYKTTSTTGTMTYAVWDTVAAGQRAIVRSGLKWTQAQMDSALAAKVCPPTCTPADSARWVNQGLNTPFQYLIIQFPNGRRDSLHP